MNKEKDMRADLDEATDQVQPQAAEAAAAEAPIEPQVERPQKGDEAEPSNEAFSEDAWREALETAVKQRDGYLDALKRAQADFQNYKRRNQAAHADGYREGVCEAITAVLPAIDNLERALSVAPKDDPLTDGVQMTLKALSDGLKRFGFEEVPAQGQDFDPEKHNAVMREQSDDPGKVLEVYQKGYRVGEKIIRYAMVKVAVE